MRLEDKVVQYLEFCRYRKELDEKTLKAYRIDLRQYFTYLASDVPSKEQIEEYITYLHRKYKQKTVRVVRKGTYKSVIPQYCTY